MNPYTKMHSDVISVALEYYGDRISQGEVLSQDEIRDMQFAFLEQQYRMKNSLDEMYFEIKDLCDKVERQNVERLLQSKLFTCFLRLHNLEYEFDNFESRIWEWYWKRKGVEIDVS